MFEEGVPNGGFETGSLSPGTGVSGARFGGQARANDDTAQLGANWTIIYTPDTGFTGTDSFVYFVDGCLQCFNGCCSEPDIDGATVTVTVTQ